VPKGAARSAAESSCEKKVMKAITSEKSRTPQGGT
jgi:hypothetical protein